MSHGRVAAKVRLGAAVVGVLAAGLTLANAAAAQLACRSWNTKEFLTAATVADVSRCLEAGANIEARIKGGWTLLHNAVVYSNSDVVNALLGAEANIDARSGEYGWTPLHLAADVGSSGVVKALLAAGANIEARTENGWTPLHEAARYSDSPDGVNALLGAGANIEARTEDGWTPLHLAAYGNSSGVVKALLTAGANIDARKEDGRTPCTTRQGIATPLMW